MQSISPLTSTDLLKKGFTPLQKFEVYDGSAWLDMTAWGSPAKCLLKTMTITPGGPGRMADIVAGSWSAELYNPADIFHPAHPTSAYAGLFGKGVKVRLSTGAKIGGTSYYWQRMIGYVSEPTYNTDTHTVSLSGDDLCHVLEDATLEFPNNYWGELATFDSQAAFTTTGSELYVKSDAMDINYETNDVSGWTADSNVSFTSIAHGTGHYSGKMILTSGTTGSIYESVISSPTVGNRYVFKITGQRMVNTAGWYISAYQTVSGDATELDGAYVTTALGAEGTVTLDVEAQSTAAIYLKVYVQGWTSGAYLLLNTISIYKCSLNWYRYALPSTATGVYYASLDGVQVSQGSRDDDGNFDGWLYDETNHYFYFDSTRTDIEAGTANLLVYYYTAQVPEDVVADLLVAAGYYSTRALALAAMSYTATGLTIDRVWADTGTTLLAAARTVCERCDYRFWFDYSGTPHFQPALAVASTADLVIDSYGHISGPALTQNKDSLYNSVSIEGAQEEPWATTDDERDTVYSGSAEDATSIADYTKKSLSITNTLFQDQTAVDNMVAALLAAYKDPVWTITFSVGFIPAPLEVGDTVSWVMTIGGTDITFKGLLRGLSWSEGMTTLTVEVSTWSGGGSEAVLHDLLDGNLNFDTVAAVPTVGALISADGDPDVALGTAPSGTNALLDGNVHDDTEAETPTLGAMPMAETSGSAVKWGKLAAGSEGQLMEMGATVPGWGRKLTVSATEPTSPTDGDIWIVV